MAINPVWPSRWEQNIRGLDGSAERSSILFAANLLEVTTIGGSPGLDGAGIASTAFSENLGKGGSWSAL